MRIPFNKPTLPPWELFEKAIHAIYGTGHITNGPVARQLEIDVEDILRVGHAVAVGCCTSGLILTLRCLGLEGKVALPSYTFFASAHSLVWNGLEPVFVDVEEDTWNISVARLGEAIEEEDGIVAAMPVHVFGNPCDVDALEELAGRNDFRLVYDSAHAMGAKVEERWVGGFGTAEVFSLSPTKIVVAGEGGVVTTQDAGLAEKLRAGRDYGNAGDYDPAFVGLNARMSEFHAALAVESFKLLELNVRRRNAIAERYREDLAGLPGITFQAVREGNRSTYKDFTILVDEEGFGLNRDALAWHLAREGIDTRKYYHPPVHRIKAYWDRWGKRYDDRLPVTNRISRQALSLPIWSHMEMEVVDRVAGEIRRAHEMAEEIKAGYLKDNPR
jgi:dTDP-4-amino-4,6-dideoxygalactose transaminase